MTFINNINKVLDEAKKDESFQKKAIEAVLAKIFKGKSALKKPLQSDNISIADIVRAITHKRCLRTPDQDFGATYLEQIIGSAIRGVIPLRELNTVRVMFRLSKLPPSELVKHKSKAKPQAGGH